ncbi:MAG: anaerobic sulfite reductase subunit AsrB [Peptoniphilus sp.]|nr:anaerobic sulfite reductase subunit AsrB [Peptoniphilus sp.]MDD7362699.1 anaerobic sulfite reductase subunit AsrB [Bacillota bacterium]MDY6044902.1 anaerobic sulfite reductase subunit AsrB [Peptoniphilus sp.]
MKNEYIPFYSKILDIVEHTEHEHTFRMAYSGDVRPGQFFEVSLPKVGEAPISVSGIEEGIIDLTIRKVGKVTDQIFEQLHGDHLFLRGPYGNGFDLDLFKGKELLVVAGGTGLSPVRGVVDYFAKNPDDCQSITLVAGFKSPADVLFLADQDRWRDTINIVLTVDALDCDPGDMVCEVGMVTEHLPNLRIEHYEEAVAIVVGPPVMMHFTCLQLLQLGFKEENIWVSQERKMCCGLGKCGHCKINESYVCVDGPVYNYSEARHMFD